MNPPGPIPLNLNLLEASGIIRPSPAWTEVEASRGRLHDLQDKQEPYDKMESDRDNVLRYATTIRRSADAIAAGLCLAAHLARFSPPARPEQSLKYALDALSSGLDLRSLDETDTKTELERCLREAFPNLNLPLPPMVNLEAWKTALANAVKEVRDAPFPDPVECRQRAVRAWWARLLALASGQPEVLPDIDYLRSRTEGSAPGRILRGRLKNLTVREWSEAYVTGISSKPLLPELAMPLWFAFGALAGLGFDVARELGTVPNRTSDAEFSETAQFLLRAASGSPKRGVIVIRCVESLTTNWRVSGVPALVVNAEEYSGPAKADLRSYFQARVQGILIEVERNERWDAALKRVDDHIRGSLKVPLGFMLSRPPESSNIPPQEYRYTVAPLDAAVACADTFLAAPAPRQSPQPA